ncbi:MAG: argininosuccinate synthase [Gammaproteobacteria bacterium RIFCSPHIGHO2_12_FULL_37_34]|nr:MAG: argininosuccinate synthase [Gammaproteobacteria bacterium RIFCSPHIGHO2_12_FULL_37_34]
MTKKIILAYSGGLDTSCSIKWLQEHDGYEVIAVTMDVGEGKDLQPIHDKALNVGATKCYILPLQELFANEFLVPALQANALYENTYPLISALSRPLIARSLVDVARQENAIAVAHGCTGKGNDQVRFDVTIHALAPHLKIVAPVRENPLSREDAIHYAKKHHIPLPIDLDNPFSIDQNLWGRSCECGVLEDPWIEPPEQAYALTKSLMQTPELAEEIVIEFEQGIPVSLNGQVKSFANIIIDLNQLAGKHGIGRIDHIENRLIGIKSREVYEAPAAITLIIAHRALEALTLVREVAHFKSIIEQRLANLIYEGLWFSPLREALYAFIQQTQQHVTGKVRVKLHKGHAVVVGRASPFSLYDKKLATYAAADQFDHQAALGFIKLFGLPTQIYHRGLQGE